MGMLNFEFEIPMFGSKIVILSFKIQHTTLY